MSADLRKALRGVWSRLDLESRRVPEGENRTNIYGKLTGADYISLSALFVGWVSALLLLRGHPNQGVLVMFGAFLLDKLDGWYARRSGGGTPFGRQVDSFIDVFAYLVPAALLYHVALAPNLVISAAVGFLVLAFGGLRLIRHNSEGFGSDDTASYYHGTTVVHTNAVVVGNYFAAALFGVWNGWIAGLLVAAACPLMVSDYKAYKTDLGHALAGVAVAAMAALATALELGWL